jgi:tight adherence protein B
VPEAGSPLSPELVLALAGGVLLLLTLVLGAAVAVVAVRPRLRLKRRLAAFGLVGEGTARGHARADGGRQRRIQEKLAELEEKKSKEASRRNRIRAELLQAGIDVNVRTYLIVTAIAGVAAGGLYAFLGFPLLFGVGPAGIGLVVAFGLPKLVLGFLASSRQKRFTAGFANALDVIIRGVRSGLPVSECLAIVGRESPEPVGEEFRQLVEGEKVGVPLDELMRRGLERMPTAEFKFFSIVIQIQKQTGGNLADTLDNLSGVLRARKKMKDKVKAMSSEARSSAMIIGSLPFLVAGLVSLMNPDYLTPLFTTKMGHVMVGGGLTWMAVGVAAMAKMINFKM